MSEAEEICQMYFEMPGTELWNENILINTLNQIKYLASSGTFENIDEALQLCDEFSKLVDHLTLMAEKGKKFSVGSEAIEQNADFNLYHNEISHTSNTILVESDTLESVFTVFDNPNFMVSRDEAIIEYSKDWFEKIQRHAQPVSKDAKRSRMQFFNQIKKKIDFTKKEIEIINESVSG